LQRIDAHVWGYNFYIKDSYTGKNGITLYGGGNLFVENTTVDSGTDDFSSFITLRGDFGSTWEGDVKIKNSRLICADGTTSSRLKLFYTDITNDWDYGHDIRLFNSIEVDGFVFDFTGKNNPGEVQALIWYGVPNAANKVYIAEDIKFKNIKVKGRTKGISAINISNAHAVTSKNTGVDGDFDTFKPTANIYIENVDLTKEYDDTWYGVAVNSISGSTYTSTSYMPDVFVVNCDFKVKFDFGRARLNCEKSTLSMVDTNTSTRPILIIRNTKIIPRIQSYDRVFKFDLSGKRGHIQLYQCELYFPIIAGTKDTTESTGMSKYNLFNTNSFKGWIERCKLADEVVQSNCFGNKGSNATPSLPHDTTIYNFENAIVDRKSAFSIFPIDDQQPSVLAYFRKGQVITNGAYSGTGTKYWQCTASGLVGSGATFVAVT
jgi:hypothetical protein